MTNEKAREVRVPLVVRGIGVGRGIAIGPLKFGPLPAEKNKRSAEASLSLLDRAARVAKEEIEALREQAERSVGEEHGEIYRIYSALIDGGELRRKIESLVESGEGLGDAVVLARDELVCAAENAGSRPERARAAHLREATEILLSALENASESDGVTQGDKKEQSVSDGEREKYILVASEPEKGLPSGHDEEDVIGIVCVGGSESSGLAAFARVRGLPALVIGEGDVPGIRYDGAGAIIDPSKGRLTVNPDLAALDKFAESTREAEETERRLASLIGLPNVTRSGKHVGLFATVDNCRDCAAALSADAEGIGLFKTESLFDRNSPRETEEKHFAEYKKALETFKGGRVLVRAYAEGGEGQESYMGRRGVRFCLARRDLFKAQLRALLRAAALGELWVAVPMAVSAEEMRRVRAVAIETVGELRSEGISYGEGLRLGVMIDTPASAICGELISAESDFFVADTDRLAGFTLAADPRDPAVSDILKKNPEPVLRLIGHAARTVHASGKGKQMGVTGDLAADPSLTERFISLGVDFISVPPPYVLEIRERIRECP